MDPIRKTSSFAYGPLINPPQSLSKITYKYNYAEKTVSVSFLFSFNFRVRVRVKNRVRVRVSFRVRFGIGNLIGGAAGTVDPCGHKTPV